MKASGAGAISRWLPLLLTALSVILLYLLWNVVVIFIISAFVAFILHPVVEYLDRRLPRVVSIVIVYLAVVVVLTVVAGFLVPVVSQQFTEFAESLPRFSDKASRLFDEIQKEYIGLPPGWRNAVDRGLAEVQQFAVRATERVIPALLEFFTGLVALVFIPFLTFFMLLDYHGYKRMLMSIVPRRSRRTVTELLRRLDQVLWNFLKGEMILMAAVGTATGVLLYFVGMPYPAVFGVLAGLLELIPNYGPFITTVVVVIIGLIVSPIMALKAGAVAIGVQVVENVFLVPVVMAKAVGLNPVTVALAIFIGAASAGPLGMLIAIPLAVMIKVVILYFYVEDRSAARPWKGPVRRARGRGRSRRRSRRGNGGTAQAGL